jgi:hypothetical protein
MERFARTMVVLVLAGCFSLYMTGCTRKFYRNQADLEVSDILTQKDQFAEWQIDQYHVYSDPRARFADDTNPDRPPMPPDDPASAEMAPNPQKPHKAGIRQIEGTGYLDLLAQWDRENRAEAAAEGKKAEAGTSDSTRPPAVAGYSNQSELTGNNTSQIKLVAGETTNTQENSNLPIQESQKPRNPQDKTGKESKEKLTEPKGYSSKGAASVITSLTHKPKPGEPLPYLIKLDQAVELGLINSREYQDAREDLYMTALAVTLQRFSFAAQYFAVGQAIRQWAGRETQQGHQNSWALNSNVGFTKLFSTGALLLANFANQTVFNMSGFGRSLTSQSTINLDLVQPLLQGSGKAVTLEPLTQAERNLLYEIRIFARFRKTFFVAIAGGGAAAGGLSGGGGSITGSSFQPVGVLAPGTFSPTAGLTNSGLVPGAIAPVLTTGDNSVRQNPGVSGQFTLGTALAAPVSGYLSTLLQATQMQVDTYNIAKLAEFLDLAKAMEEGGDISELQVQQFEQALLRGRTALLSDQQQFLQALDQFKLQIGVPTALPIEQDDSAFRQLNQQFRRYEDLFKDYVIATETEPEPLKSPENAANVRNGLRRIFTSSALVQGTRFRNQIGPRWGAWEKLSANDLQKQLETHGVVRRGLLDTKTDLETKGETLSPADQQKLDELDFEISLGEFEKQLRNYESRPWQKFVDPQIRNRQQQLDFRYVVNKFVFVVTEARNQRLEQLRATWPDLAKLCVNGVDLLKADLDEAEAAVAQTALANRLDLMNVHGLVVDAWRQIAIFANALLGTLSVQYHMDTTTPAGLAQPLAFDAHRTQQELILNTQLPLVRISQRNSYRACLINFQRARRILQRAEDQVAFDTRGELRQLRLQEESYRIQQRQVELGYLTVENSLDTLKAPPQGGAAAGDTATRAATLTNQLITAQTNLYNAQFAMTTIWITYLNTRLQLYRDMELMPLDYRGVWIDDIATRECAGGTAGSSDSQSPCDGHGRSARDGERSEPKALPLAPAQAVEPTR